MRAMLLLGLAACGRFGFGVDREAPADAPIELDMDTPMLGCATNTTPPSTVHIRGQAFRYTSFDNDRAPVAGAAITASPSVDGAPIASTTSASDGSYDLAIETGGAAQVVTMRYSVGSDFVTYVVFDQRVADDVMPPQGEVLAPGDGPIWSTGQMDSVFSAAGLTRDPTRAMVSIGVRDCDGVPIADATVLVDPAPGAMVYQDEDGRPVAALSATKPRFGQAFAMNALGGELLVTVSHPVHTFEPFSITVIPGATNTITFVRPVTASR